MKFLIILSILIISWFNVKSINWLTPLMFPTDEIKTTSYRDPVTNILYFTSSVYDDSELPLTSIIAFDGATLTTISNSIHGFVYSMILYNGKLVIGGMFKSIGNTLVNNVAYYNNGQFYAFSDGEIAFSGLVFDFEIYNEKLFVGGEFQDGQSVKIINVTSIEALEFSPNGIVTSLLNNNGVLLVGGTFSKIGYVNCENIAVWDDVSWQALTNGLPGSILKFISFQGKIYAGGAFMNDDSTNTLFSIAYYESGSWHSLGLGIAGVVTTMSVYKNQLFVGGSFSLVNGEEMFNLVKWTGSDWENCDNGITGEEEGMVSSLEVFENNLYVFGFFDSANSISCNNAIIYSE